MTKPINFALHHTAKVKGDAEAEKLVAYLKENGPKDNNHWTPEELEEGMAKIIREGELHRADK